MYTMLLSVPLEGPLEKGGVVFVLRSGQTGNNTSWLKVSGVSQNRWSQRGQRCQHDRSLIITAPETYAIAIPGPLSVC